MVANYGVQHDVFYTKTYQLLRIVKICWRGGGSVALREKFNFGDISLVLLSRAFAETLPGLRPGGRSCMLSGPPRASLQR